jgi:hypothetical protein
MDRREIIQECLRRASEARLIAESSTSPVERAEWLEVERHWRRLARRNQLEESQEEE